jgi:hypothetical protein
MAETPQGSDLATGLVDVGDGIRVENRLRLGAMIWLENKLGKSVQEYFEGLDPNKMRATEIQPIIVALILQANPNMTDEEAEKLSLRVDIAVMGDVIANVLTVEAKNSPLPEVDLTENAPA